MTYTNKDSLKVSENEDGTFAIEWDENDPRYSFLSGMTQEEINAYFTRALEEYIKEIEAENNAE
jgi:hypothetical protein